MSTTTTITKIAQSVFSFSHFKGLGFSEFIPNLIIFAEKFFMGSSCFEFAFIPFFRSKNKFEDIANFIKEFVPRMPNNGENVSMNFAIYLFSGTDGKIDFDNFRKNPELINRIKQFADFAIDINKFFAKNNFGFDFKFILIPALQDEISSGDEFDRTIDFIKEELAPFGFDNIEFRRSPAPSAAFFGIDGISQEFFGSFDDFKNFPINEFSENDRFIIVPDEKFVSFEDFNRTEFENPHSIFISTTGQFTGNFHRENDSGFASDNFMFAFRKLFNKAN